MSSPQFVMRVVCLVGALSAAACSGQSPLAPGAGNTFEPSLSEGTSAALAAVAPGTYTLTFHGSPAGNEVTTLPVFQELVLKARVTDSLGQAARTGTVTFEYCSRRGGPPNDINRADEAPMAECAAGTATWKSLLRMGVNPAGEAAMNFGFVQIPRTIGFRFRYQGGKRAGIADGVGGPRDIEFTAQ